MCMVTFVHHSWLVYQLITVLYVKCLESGFQDYIKGAYRKSTFDKIKWKTSPRDDLWNIYRQYAENPDYYPLFSPYYMVETFRFTMFFTDNDTTGEPCVYL